MEKKLQRSRKHKVFAGIAGGLGEYLDIDPIIVRVIFVLITIFHGAGLLIYIIMWIVIPEEPFDVLFTNQEPNFEENFDNSAPEGSDLGSQSVFDEAAKSVKDMKMSSGSSNGRVIIGAILILIGILFLSEKFFPFIDFELVFAIGLIILGISLLLNFFNKSEKSS